MKRYRLMRPAKADLDEIWSWCTQDAGFETADRLIQSLADSFLTLASMPSAGRKRDDLKAGMRSFPSSSYIIYYTKPPRGRVQILRVIHGRRDQKKAWKDLSRPHRHHDLG
jgi:toxin ParE1/3/4